ncbi:MAG: hypothetical protein IPL40_13050 [Proteobacteria bacterium]|nr:hypothetical protein [Pseudomonadota bacterium]
MLEFLITGDLAQQVLGLAQRDPKLARTLAQQFVARVEPVAMQGFLLDDAAAIELLTRRLAQDPARTLEQLQRLPLAKRVRVAATKPARRAAAASASPAGKSAPAGKRRRRQRLSTADAAVLKRAILEYVGAHPGANRSGILSAVAIPTDGLYNRVMGELRQAGELAGSGARSSMVYRLKRRGAAAAAVAGGAKGSAKGKRKAAGGAKAPAKGPAPKGKPAAKAKPKVKGKGKAGAKRRAAAAVTARPGSKPGDAGGSASSAS